MVAANKGYKEVVDALLEGGANVHYQHEVCEACIVLIAREVHVLFSEFDNAIKFVGKSSFGGKKPTFLYRILKLCT